jgi:hypothetical protein
MISFLPNLIEISAALGIYPDERKMIFQNTAQVLIEGFGRVNVEERVVLCSSYTSPRHTRLPCQNAGKAQKFALVQRFIWGISAQSVG